MPFTGVVVKICFVATLLQTVESHINQHRGESEKYKRDKRNVVNKEIEDYLTRFGYLPQSDLETGALRTMKQLKDAIRCADLVNICLKFSNIFFIYFHSGFAHVIQFVMD